MFRRQVYPKQLTPLFSSEIFLEIIFFLVFFELVFSLEHMTVRPQHSKAGSYLKTCQLHCVGPKMYISDSNCLSLISEKPMDKCNRDSSFSPYHIYHWEVGRDQRTQEQFSVCYLALFMDGRMNRPTGQHRNRKTLMTNMLDETARPRNRSCELSKLGYQRTE